MVSKQLFIGLALIGLILPAGCSGTGGTDCLEDICNGQCVNLQVDPNNCGSCGNQCAPDERCEAGTCLSLCGSGLQYCSGVCVNLRNNPDHCGACGHGCTPGQSCTNGVCTGACPPGQTECGGTCVNTNTDPNNCGSCGNRCDGACFDGSCATTCPEGMSECAGVCVDTMKDEENCGGCGIVCGPGEDCNDGVCGLNCPEGLSPCDGECVDLQTDRNNCGRCGNYCNEGELCNDGSCTAEGCPGGLEECSGTCVDLNTDRNNCGRCGNVCGEGETCEGGSCELSCPRGQTVCSGECVDLSTDRTNCGACGNVCRSDQICTGRCRCSDSRTECGGACVDTDVDPENCGSCGRRCTGSEACVDGTCTMSCPEGTTPCDGFCVDLRSNRHHCGACGNACDEGETCSGGGCTSTGVVAGDTCSAPIDVSGGGRFEGSAATAGADYTGSCGGAGGRDIVFRYTLSETTDVYMNTFGSNYDTVLYVTEACGGPDEVGCSDDERTTLQSELLLRDQRAGTYYVVVDSYGTTARNYVFDIYFSAPTHYGGDACGEPEWLDLASTTVVDGNTCSFWWWDARDDTAGCRRGTGGFDVVRYFLVRSRTTVTFETCEGTEWDTLLDLRRVCNDDSDAARVACNDDACSTQSRITATLDPGVYYLWIDGFAADECGSYEIHITTE